MLKKCLKHEWKACWKNLTLLNGAAVFMGAVGGGGVLFSRIHELQLRKLDTPQFYL